MADLPPEKVNEPLGQKISTRDIKVTQENAPLLTVHYLAQIYARLGYLIKLLEEKKDG